MVLADAAASENGKHYIHGAGWDRLSGTSFPITHPSMGVAVRLRIPWNETNEPHAVSVDVVDGDGVSILQGRVPQGTITVGRPPNIPVGQDQVLALAFTLVGVAFEKEGDYVVVVRLDGMDQARSPFLVQQLPGQGPPR